MIWTSVLVASLGCYLLKLVGFSVPPRMLEAPKVRRIVELLPVALLSAWWCCRRSLPATTWCWMRGRSALARRPSRY